MPVPFATPLGRAILSGAPRPAPPPVGPSVQPPVAALQVEGQSYTGGVQFTTPGTTVDAAAGDMVILLWHGSGTFNSAPQDSAGNTYTVGPVINSGGRMTNAYKLLTAPLPAGSTFQINAATTGSGNYIVVIVKASSGMDNTSAVDSGSSTDTTIGPVTFTPSVVPVLVIMACWTDGGGDSFATPAGWTLLKRSSPGSPNTRFDTLFAFYKIMLAGAGSPDSTFTGSQVNGTNASNALVVKV